MPEFAIFPLRERPDAVAALTGMYTRYLETAAAHVNLPLCICFTLDSISRLKSGPTLRPNASPMEKVALCQIGHLEKGEPEQLGMLMGVGRCYPHMDIWGVCCGTWEKHLGKIAENLKRQPG